MGVDPAVGVAGGPPADVGAVLGPTHDSFGWRRSAGRFAAAAGWAWEGGRFRGVGRLASGTELERLAMLTMGTSTSCSSATPSLRGDARPGQAIVLRAGAREVRRGCKSFLQGLAGWPRPRGWVTAGSGLRPDPEPRTPPIGGVSRLGERCDGFVIYINVNIDSALHIQSVHSRQVSHGLGHAN